MEDSLYQFIGFIASISVLAIPFLYFKRRRARGTKAVGDSGLGAIDRRELEKAEGAISGLDPIAERDQLLKTHALVAELSTRKGHSASSVAELEAKLLEAGIPTQVRFQAFGPIGFGDSIISEHGEFQIFVAQDKVDAAQEILSRLRDERANSER